jgi:hypothetical protein
MLLRKPASSDGPPNGARVEAPRTFYKFGPGDVVSGRSGRSESASVGLPGLGKANDLITKFLQSPDPKDVPEVQKTMKEMRVFLPEKGPYVDAWNSLNEEITKHGLPSPPSQPSSAPRESRSSGPSKAKPAAMQSDMETLMAMVAEREAAVTARNAMGAARTVAQKAGAGEKTMLFRLARYEEGNAEEAFQKNDYSGAKALFRVLEKTFALSAFGGEDAAGLAALRQYVAGLRGEAAAGRGGADPWMLEIARETEHQADAFLAKKDLENAGGAFLRAAFLYQKIKDTAARPS